MAGFLLYLPGVKGADPAHIDRFGLADLRSDRGPEFAECFAWGNGSLAFWRSTPEGPPLDVSAYDWNDSPDGSFKLGVLRGQQVTPADIQRSQVRAGYWITCQDGQRWQIPAAAQLPHKHGLGPDGGHVREVVATYRDYWDKSRQYAVQMFQAIDQLEALRGKVDGVEQEVEFTLADTWDFCCRALSINYRLTPSIISMLGLIDDDAMANIVKAAIDLPCLIGVKNEKKKDRVGIPVGLNG